MARPLVKGITRLSKSRKSLVIFIEKKLYYVTMRDLRNVLDDIRDSASVYSWK